MITLFKNTEVISGYERSVWSQDSNWFAVSFSTVRFSDTSVYHRSGENSVEFKTDELRVDAKGDVRNEYVRPIRWVKPGVLLLEQYDIFRGGSGDATYRFTAKFDEKTGNFQITSKEESSVEGVGPAMLTQSILRQFVFAGMCLRVSSANEFPRERGCCGHSQI